jgi:NAD(P)-dependent dehydrogenase (short-subunit alcohol dehydrogenase family)
MSERLAGKVALVTGGSGDIGRAITLGLAQEGAAVAVAYAHNGSKADEVVSDAREATGGQAVAIRADLTSWDEAERLISQVVDQFGRIDILVNAAGSAHFIDFIATTEADWDEQFAVNAKAAFAVSQAAARRMRSSGGGRIINVTSISADRADPDLVAYCASKGAANSLTRAMASALAAYNITVNAVAPGTTVTGMNRERLAKGDLAERLVNLTPTGRLGTPQDHVSAVLYFTLPESSWTTGVVLTVDGGFTA